MMMIPSIDVKDRITTLPLEILLLIVGSVVSWYQPTNSFIGLTYSLNTRCQIPGECETVSRETLDKPGICQLQGRLGRIALTKFLEQRKFVLVLSNFDAHSLQHAVKTLDDYTIKSCHRLTDVDIYFRNCGCDLSLENLAKWVLLFRTYHKALSGTLHFSGIFCSNPHQNKDSEENLLRDLARIALHDKATPTRAAIATLLERLGEFVTRAFATKGPDLPKYFALDESLRTTSTFLHTFWLWVRFDLENNLGSREAWTGHCTLKTAPEFLETIHTTSCLDYYPSAYQSAMLPAQANIEEMETKSELDEANQEGISESEAARLSEEYEKAFGTADGDVKPGVDSSELKEANTPESGIHDPSYGPEGKESGDGQTDETVVYVSDPGWPAFDDGPLWLE
ncbi:hypothetical protein B9Z65_3537 [Elsinoe australis]|uniref:Uncharacterized protein n=1 Tax=Elsinoe australis TaxID=40998 RepID=A0A2P8AFI0_9PEZI|nr:hypothetical protein B9Z65_3537 [Elsinoe australis]